MSADPSQPAPEEGKTAQLPPSADLWSMPTSPAEPPTHAYPSVEPPTRPYSVGGPAATPYPAGPAYPSPGPAYPPGPGYPPALPGAPGHPYPTSAPPGGFGGGHGPVVAQIGEIAVTPPVIRTPSGEIPLAGSSWHVADYWQSEQKIPTWAIVCAILGFCVLTVFSLLFLLARETIHRGTVQVTVSNGPRQYVARIPVTHPTQVQQINDQVNYVRSLAAI